MPGSEIRKSAEIRFAVSKAAAGFTEDRLWNRNNDFANVLAGFHVAMRVCDVLQLKGSINYRDKFPGPHAVNNEILGFAQARRNSRSFKQRITAHGQALDHCEATGKRCRLRAESAINDDHAARSRRFSQRFDKRA